MFPKNVQDAVLKIQNKSAASALPFAKPVTNATIVWNLSIILNVIN
jgi:hypothetical protein